MGQQYSHLSSEERILIEKPHCEQHPGIRRTAEGIGRDKSTVSRETEARPVVRVQRERGVPPLPGQTAGGRAVDLGSVLFGAGRAEEGRPASAQAQETASHGFGPAALLGAGRTAQGWSPELIGGRLEAMYPDEPPCASATSASTSGSTPNRRGRWTCASIWRVAGNAGRGKRAGRRRGRASRCACPSRTGPSRSAPGGNSTTSSPTPSSAPPVETLHEHAGRTQEPQTVRPARRRQERVRHGPGRIRDIQGPAAGREDRPHRAPRKAHQIRGRLLPQRARPHDQIAGRKRAAGSDGAVSVGNQPPMLLKNSDHTVDANLQEHSPRGPVSRTSRRTSSTRSSERSTTPP